MTLFIDLRATPVGGIVAADAHAWDDETNMPVAPDEFTRRVRGLDLLLATHGFNVSRADGLSSLSLWHQRSPLPPNALFVGVLWPGDSRFIPFVDYAYEGTEAIASGKLLSAYLNQNATVANSLAFFSHSLGARVILETIRGMNLPVRRAILMAGAIENDCLAREYADAAAKVGVAGKICLVASEEDAVLQWAFPPGNLVGEIVMHGHPYDRTALGRFGPQRPLPANLTVVADQLSKIWDYGHLDYLAKGDWAPPFDVPVTDPTDTDPCPPEVTDPSIKSWKPAWSSARAVTHFK